MEVSPAVMGVGLGALLMIGLGKHERQTVDSSMQRVTAMPEVRAAFFIAVGCGLGVLIVVRDTKNLKKLPLYWFIAGHEVAHIETLIIFDATQRYDLTDQHR